MSAVSLQRLNNRYRQGKAGFLRRAFNNAVASKVAARCQGKNCQSF
jgi:hypothetical protein